MVVYIRDHEIRANREILSGIYIQIRCTCPGVTFSLRDHSHAIGAAFVVETVGLEGGVSEVYRPLIHASAVKVVIEYNLSHAWWSREDMSVLLGAHGELHHLEEEISLGKGIWIPEY